MLHIQDHLALQCSDQSKLNDRGILRILLLLHVRLTDGQIHHTHILDHLTYG